MNRRAGGVRLALASLLALAAAPARPHVVYGRPSLHRLVADADLVARVRILDAGGWLVVEDPPLRRPVVTAALEEVWKGETPAEPVRFAQHGHGVAPYAKGEEVLLFLRRLDRSRELAHLAAQSDLRWVSLQEHDAKLPLAPASRPAYAAAVRGYLALESIPDPGSRLAAHRRLTLELLKSAEPALADSALADLVTAGGKPLLTEAEVPAVLSLVDDPGVRIGVRVALLALLEERGLVAAPPRWARLVAAAAGPDRRAAIRAAGAHPSPEVTAELTRLLDGGDPETAAEAAVALGAPGNDDAVAPLASVLAGGDPRLGRAAVRGLGRIGTPRAREALETAAESHPDADIRRRALAELRSEASGGR